MDPRAKGSARASTGLDIEKALLKAEMSRDLFGTAEWPVRRGRFELVRWRGRGAMGVVYEARDTASGEHVALKVLSRFDGQAIQRLKREFRSLSAMDHPNLVRLEQLFYEDGQWFFSMELVQGVPFDQFVRAQLGEPYARLRGALCQLVAAVTAIHAAGKLHRDLKPTNVLVDASGRVVVLDFGLVQDEQSELDALLTQSEIVGTPAYMAPELATGQNASRASDWYAVGVMLFEALTGRLPFEGSPLAVLSEKQQRDAPDPRALRSDLPQALSELCAQLLQREPEARGSADSSLRELARTACSTERGWAPLDTARAQLPSVFVGREPELAELSRALSQVRPGVTVAVLVHGASGVGKSALLERFGQSVGERVLLLRGRCHEQESVPYKVFDGVVDGLVQYLRGLAESDVRGLLPRHLAALMQLFPVLGQVPGVALAVAGQVGPADARELRNLAFVALKELLLRLTDRVPVVIAVDDLHWGDIDSAHMLASVFSAPEPPPLLFVGAFRGDEVDRSEFLRALLRERGLAQWMPQRLHLARLPQSVASELARQLLGADAGAAARSDAIALEADGVPFFIAELAAHVDSLDGGAQAGPGVARLSLERLILLRVAGLPASAQRLLQVLSVAAGPLEQSVANEAAGLGRGERGALLRLRGARLLRVRTGDARAMVETYHDRIRETLTGHMSQAQLRETHQALADALHSHGIADPERLVLHYTHAGDRVRAGETAVRAGLAASQKLAFHHAARLFERALPLLPLPGREPYELYSWLGDARANAGRGVAAGDAYLEAADQAPAQHVDRLRALAAVQYLGTPKVQDGMALARQALRGVGVSLPQPGLVSLGAYGTQRLLLAAESARLLPRRRRALPAHVTARLQTLRDLAPAVSWVDGQAGATLQARYLREALAAADPGHLLHALSSEVVGRAIAGGPRHERSARRRLAQLTQVAKADGSVYASALVHMAQAHCSLWSARRFRDALAQAARAQELLATQDAALAWERTCVALIQLIALTYAGELPELAALTAAQEREARERDDQFVPMMLTSCSSLCRLVRDQPDAAITMLESMRSAFELSANFRPTWTLRMAEALSYAGHCQAGFELSEAGWPAFAASAPNYSEFVRANTVYYRARSAAAAYFESGDRHARRVASATILMLPDDASAHGASRAAMLGALAEAQGEHAHALRLMELACERFRACQADLNLLHAERCLEQFRGNLAGVARVDAALAKQGVVNPRRWVWTFIPTRE